MVAAVLDVKIPVMPLSDRHEPAGTGECRMPAEWVHSELTVTSLAEAIATPVVIQRLAISLNHDRSRDRNRIALVKTLSNIDERDSTAFQNNVSSPGPTA